MFPISLGAGCRAFESHHSDQNPLKSVDFSGFFLSFIYCDTTHISLFFTESSVQRPPTNSLICFLANDTNLLRPWYGRGEHRVYGPVSWKTTPCRSGCRICRCCTARSPDWPPPHRGAFSGIHQVSHQDSTSSAVILHLIPHFQFVQKQKRLSLSSSQTRCCI